MRLLIQHNASLVQQHQELAQPLAEACSLGLAVCVELLLDAGAQVDGGGWRPALHCAAESGNDFCVGGIRE